jgi:hypothetical protein
MSKKDVSIEYAHIYTNNQINDEHRLSLNILSDLKDKLTRENKTYSLVVLVDDYSFPDPSFNYDEFTLWLKDSGFSPDIVFRESQLIPLCDWVLSIVEDHKLKNELGEYIRSKKYPCSLFIAAWYLLRLGYLEDPSFNKKFYAKGLINILPESFKPFEEKALEIINASQFSEAKSQIGYSYIAGRLIV